MKSFHKHIPAFTYSGLFTVLLVLSTGCNEKEIIHNYPSGEISLRYTEINGKKEGVMLEYYKDGKLKIERRFEHDIQHGKSVMYYPGGQIKKVQYFEDGKLQGGDTLFYENGKPEFVKHFENGQLHGYMRKYDINDSMVYEAKFVKDVLTEERGKPFQTDSLIKD